MLEKFRWQCTKVASRITSRREQNMDGCVQREPGSTNSPRHSAVYVPSARYACGDIKFSAIEFVGLSILHTCFDFDLQCCFGLLKARGLVLVQLPNGKGSATLSMGYAGARLGRSILAGLAGRRRVECAYVKSDITDLPYFTSKVVFGENGVQKVLPIGELNEYETKRLDEAKAALKAEIETGVKYAEANELNC